MRTGRAPSLGEWQRLRRHADNALMLGFFGTGLLFVGTVGMAVYGWWRFF